MWVARTYNPTNKQTNKQSMSYHVSVVINYCMLSHCGLSRFTADAFEGAVNLVRWSSTTCSKNCFCSSFRVREALKSWMSATPRSARSLTTLMDFTMSWIVVVYVSRFLHALGSSSYKLSDSSSLEKSLS